MMNTTKQPESVQRTIRLLTAVNTAVEQLAEDRGVDAGELIADEIARLALPHLDPPERAQIEAELELKELVREHAWAQRGPDLSPRVTLEIFREIREHHLDLYKRAIGSDDPFRRKNPNQARINRSLGSRICTAAGARAIESDNGRRIVEQVRGELITAYTMLEPKAKTDVKTQGRERNDKSHY